MKKNSDIFVLLVGLIIVSCSLGFIHRRITAQENREFNTRDSAMASISPLFIAHDTDGMGQVLVRYPVPVITEILPTIMGPDSLLVDSEKSLFFAALLYYSIQHKQGVDSQLLVWYETYHTLLDAYPLLYYSARQPYCALLAPFSHYLIKQGHGKRVHQFFIDSFLFCINKQDPCSLVLLCHAFNELFIVEAAHMMTSLLSTIVFENKNVMLAEVVIAHGADVNFINTAVTPPETLLMKAVENNNKDLVELLLKNGATVDTMTDIRVGTALQIAFVKKYIEVEALLRTYGALR